MVHRTALRATLSALSLGLLLAITGCDGSGETYSGLSYSSGTSPTALVSWTPPVQRTDGSALTDLAGYRVYYGKALNSMSRIIEIRNPGQTSQFIDDLNTGTWYFAVTAYTRDGLESEMSNLGAKRIL
ncbi:fibronectin type III domain-containing protein [Thioalkalivibrio sp.]|uniref:fibronectin type III domain-containing protein n=1 Tax=Thioalkalivibrio sp. TaxID=2093813 RepID=UPI0012D5FEF7|nr:fibronectin type III domain-containing protein [Thioalkalivibrio sp.]TVP83865.1 MAG: fibronectin type III domain-containing protein [Thioalkalivibrio sp.]